MQRNRTILIIGNCGSGKTWVMRQLIEHFNLSKADRVGLFDMRVGDGKLAVLGKYDGSMFEGTDKLSMAVNKDIDHLLSTQICRDLTIVGEGDRLFNKTFLSKFCPLKIKICDNGAHGRKLRGSNQSAGHLARIETRVKKATAHYNVRNSQEALELVLQLLYKIGHEKS